MGFLQLGLDLFSHISKKSFAQMIQLQAWILSSKHKSRSILVLCFWCVCVCVCVCVSVCDLGQVHSFLCSCSGCFALLCFALLAANWFWACKGDFLVLCGILGVFVCKFGKLKSSADHKADNFVLDLLLECKPKTQNKNKLVSWSFPFFFLLLLLLDLLQRKKIQYLET